MEMEMEEIKSKPAPNNIVTIGARIEIKIKNSNPRNHKSDKNEGEN